MKKLVLVIHGNLKQDTADLLHKIEQVQGFTFSNIEGHGKQSTDTYLSTRDKVVGYTPRVRVDILLEDENVMPVLIQIRKSNIGLNNHGFYWITEIEEYGQL